MTAPDLVLDDQLCFALHSASRAMTGCYRSLLDDIGLTYSQYAVMLVLWEDETVALSVLCRRLHLDTGTLSPLLKRLEAQGLLERRRRSDDERMMQVTLSDAGRALRDRAAGAQARVRVATGLTDGALAVLRGELTALAERLRAADLQP
ncbi:MULTISPECIES: MarR family transcriptional regulator [unclassified Pseudonocardia]|jgi:DNA-binding MarR family transcriptional regulator|uniref:MarR family winged helix-turn-helix transcriptional regulator n=1 Tax=unclassified Pseudonocardia TaxID=2619320 RepID=UPI0009639F2A|nr:MULTISPECIES: MarR family transcriptional regulator [unclassified Pseudonocardia]MBN9102073.1 MarR family transcriptional regulator [Pseudonocardia sp.]OJY39144.1 MAG: MarR family transcriptional regulator [Pseudonocardia sp. 73-21]